jgi:hypothetical protein
VEYYSAIKRNEVLICAASWRNLYSVKEAKYKGHILYGSFYIKWPERQIYKDKKQIGACWGTDRGKGQLWVTD